MSTVTLAAAVVSVPLPSLEADRVVGDRWAATGLKEMLTVISGDTATLPVESVTVHAQTAVFVSALPDALHVTD